MSNHNFLYADAISHLCQISYIYVNTPSHLCQDSMMSMSNLRDSDESDTVSTDDTWGGDGRHEYGRKGLPHALQHARELVVTYGHHGGVCTCIGEAGHKTDIKAPAKRSRTYGDKNLTQSGMLKHVQKQELYAAVKKVNDENLKPNDCDDESDEDIVLADQADPDSTLLVLRKLNDELHYADDWGDIVPLPSGEPPRMWGSTFLSKSVLITRNELLTLLRTKLEMDPTWASILRLTTVRIRCFGSATLHAPDYQNTKKRKVVGVSRTSRRRDFVRLEGTEDNTAMSAQVICFLQVTGLRNAQIPVPEGLRVPTNNTCSDDQVTLTVVRWLSPDSRCLLRDAESLPLCPPPFGANQALWTFSKRRTRRSYFSDNLFARQLHLFPGRDQDSQRESAMKFVYAMYDLVQLETIKQIMNCTFIDDNHDSIMETVTLPFN